MAEWLTRDAETGSHIWADRYDREMADVVLVQDEIVNQIVAKIAGSYGAIEPNEAKTAARKSPSRSRPTILSCGHAKRCSGIGPARPFAWPAASSSKPSRSIPRMRKRAASWPGSQ